MYRASLVCCFVNILAGNNDKQCCVNVFSDQQKNILRAERESYGSAGSRAINSSQIPQTALHGPSLKESHCFLCVLYVWLRSI